MIEAGHLIFEAGAVALLDDGRRDEDEQVALDAGVQLFLEEIAEDRDVAEDRAPWCGPW